MAKEWFHVTSPDTLYHVSRYALLHDRVESVSGDIPSIIKDCVDEDKMHRRYLPELTQELVPLSFVETVMHCVKIADRLEALYFLNREKAMGNQTVNSVWNDVRSSLTKYLDNNGLQHIKPLVDERCWGNSFMVTNPMNRRED